VRTEYGRFALRCTNNSKRMQYTSWLLPIVQVYIHMNGHRTTFAWLQCLRGQLCNEAADTRVATVRSKVAIAGFMSVVRNLGLLSSAYFVACPDLRINQEHRS
jgi:hypothetical protein